MSQRTITTDQYHELAKIHAKADPRKPRRRTEGQWLARFMGTPSAPPASIGEATAQRSLFEKHDAVVWSIRLPLAPTVDHWMTQPKHGKGWIYTCEARAYKKAVSCFWRRRWDGRLPEPLTGRLRLLVTISFPQEGRNDLSNRIKPLEDALTDCGVWLDDSQIDDERVFRGPICRPLGYMDVTVEVIT